MSISLMPDEKEQGCVNISDNRQETRQPYGLIAVMSGLLLLLISRAFLHSSSWLIFIVLSGSFIIYFALLSKRPKLPSSLLSIVPAELGLLYSLPWMMVYHVDQLQTGGIRVLVWSILFSGVTGVMLGYLLKMEKYPEYVIPLNFLSMFIFFSLLLRFLP